MNTNTMPRTQELTEISHKTSEISNATHRNSWAEQNQRRESIRILGKIIELDEWLDWRIKWGQRGAAINSGLSLLIFIINSVFLGGYNVVLFALFVVFAIGVIASGLLLYYKNVSFVIARRLLKEVNVVMILVLSILIFTIDCVVPNNSFSPINGFMYAVCVSLFLFLDAIKKKSRKFVLIVGFVFALGTLYLIYERIFSGTDVGVILFKYSDNYVFHKRSIKRSCFVQIFLFSLNGIWTMFKDKKMEMMMFATGNIYRETGTASKYVEDTQHSMQMRRETADSRV